MESLVRAVALLEREDGFILSTHLHPDGDGIGSMLALGGALRARGKRVAMVQSDGVPGTYSFLAGAADVLPAPPDGFAPALLVALDCGDRERIALPSMDAGLPILNIDHHISNDLYGLINLVDGEASATGEIVHRILTAGGYQLDRGIGTALYVAIATDTGFFRYANASTAAFLLSARLVEEFGLEPGKIAEIVHEQKSLNAVKLLGVVLSTLKLSGSVAWMYLNREMLAAYPVEMEEIEGYINYARSIIGVEIALFFKEVREGEVRISWRSGPNADVSLLASHFGGGGHARAAGCTVSGNLASVVDKVLSYLARWQEGR